MRAVVFVFSMLLLSSNAFAAPKVTRVYNKLGKRPLRAKLITGKRVILYLRGQKLAELGSA